MAADFYDDVLGKAYDARLMKRLLGYVRPYVAPSALATALMLLATGAELAFPLLTEYVVDEVIKEAQPERLVWVLWVAIGIVVVGFLARFGQIYTAAYVGQKVVFDLRMQVFRHIQKMALSFFDRYPVGTLMTRVTHDIDTLSQLVGSLVVVAGSVAVLIGIVFILLAKHLVMALLVFTTVPLLMVATNIFRKYIRESYREIRRKLARINAYLQESIAGMRVVHLFSREEKNAEEFDELNADFRNEYFRTIRYYATYYPVVGFIEALCIGIILFYGGRQVFAESEDVTVGLVILFVLYARRFYWPIRELSERYNLMQAAMASSERVFHILDTEPAIQDAAETVPFTGVREAVEFRNVWFAYPDSSRNGGSGGEKEEPEWVLKDVSFRIPAGQSYAIVGPTGGGKTTVINLLCRFYDPQRGQILIDGVDIRQFNQQELRRRIGVVLQDVFLFSGTIDHNIRLGDESITHNEMREAASYVNAIKFIEKLPENFNHAVAERGSTLSVGERQLLSFARCLAFDPDVLVLDEATSSVDTETEKLIQEAILKILRRRTSIIIAHRLSTVQSVDQILVLHKGRIRERGTHNELLATGGIYYRLFQLQYKDQIIPKS